MVDLLRVDGRKTRLRVGVGHDGKPRALARPGDKVLDTHHTAAPSRGLEHQQTDDTLPRKSTTGKIQPNVPIHSGMSRMQQQLKGMGHAIGSAPDAGAADPLAPTVPGKRMSPTTVHPSMTRQQHFTATFNGEDILAEALAVAEPDHPAKLGRRGV